MLFFNLTLGPIFGEGYIPILSDENNLLIKYPFKPEKRYIDIKIIGLTKGKTYRIPLNILTSEIFNLQQNKPHLEDISKLNILSQFGVRELDTQKIKVFDNLGLSESCSTPRIKLINIKKYKEISLTEIKTQLKN